MSPIAFAVFAALLIAAAVGDVRSYRIPNWLCAAVAVAGIVLAWPGSADVWLARGEAVLAAAAVGMILYLARALGGGDYKLLVGVACWMPLGELMIFAVFLAVAGGVQAILTLIWRRVRPPKPSEARPHARAMPYAVSIAAAGIAWGLLALQAR